MRSSIVALALVASAVPALSAPFPENVDSFDIVAREPLDQRDVADLEARWDFRRIRPVSKVPVPFHHNLRYQKREEFVNLLVERAMQDVDPSGAINLGSVYNIGKDIYKGANAIFGGNNNNHQKQQREFVDLLVRRAAEHADASGALGFGSLFKIGKGIFKGAQALFGGHKKRPREFNELEQRDEFVSMLMRRAANEANESGALGLGSIFKIGKGIFKGAKMLFGGHKHKQKQQQRHRREFMELLERHAAQEADASGALNLKSVFKIGKAAFNGAKAIFGGSNNDDQQQQRREFYEFEAREDELEARDDMMLELFARQDESQLLRREEEYARSLKELD